MQAYWLLEEYATGDAIIEAKGAMRWLQHRLSDGLLKRLDSVYNPSRVLRLPNTVNRKKDLEVRCVIVSLDRGRVYSLQSFSKVEDDSDPSGKEFSEVVFEPTSLSATQLMSRARAGGAAPWALDALTRPDLHDSGDASGLDFAVMRELTLCLTPGEV